MLHDMESRVIIMKNVWTQFRQTKSKPSRTRRNCIVRFYSPESKWWWHQHTLKWRGLLMFDSDEQSLKREEKNVLDQNVNGKEVKRVIYFLIAKQSPQKSWRQKAGEQQLKLLILWSFTSGPTFFAFYVVCRPMAQFWSFLSLPFLASSIVVHRSLHPRRNANDTMLLLSPSERKTSSVVVADWKIARNEERFSSCLISFRVACCATGNMRAPIVSLNAHFLLRAR